MKKLTLSTAILFLSFAASASAQLKPDQLKGRWALIGATPTLESQVKDYAELAGYSPSRQNDLITEIRDMKKKRTPQLLVFTESEMTFEGVEVFGGSLQLSYKIEGKNLNVSFNKVASKTGGAGTKATELVPKYYAVGLRGTTLTLKSSPIPGLKSKTISYKFKRYTKVTSDMREWTTKSGKKFKAKVVDFKNNVLYLANEKGKQMKMSPKGLGTEDQKYLVELIKASK